MIFPSRYRRKVGVACAYDVDPRLRRAMCVMECLYNEDVREIQDKINYIIEQVQILTAHPATDASLGVVGF